MLWSQVEVLSVQYFIKMNESYLVQPPVPLHPNETLHPKALNPAAQVRSISFGDIMVPIIE